MSTVWLNKRESTASGKLAKLVGVSLVWWIDFAFGLGRNIKGLVLRCWYNGPNRVLKLDFR